MKEFRCIIFNEQEVLTAIIERRRRAREPLPAGTIRGVAYDIREKGAVLAEITVADDHGKTDVVLVPVAELAAALIDYCLNRRIPLPAGSRRWIEVINRSELILLMTVQAKRRKKPARAAAVPG